MAPARNPDLHGMVPDKASVALLLLDVINGLEFDGGDALLEHAVPMARHLRELKRRAKTAGIPAVYVNDNYGRWRSDFRALVGHALEDGVRGRPVAELLHPEEDDYFVLKPKHSGFYSTTLDVLLEYLGARTLVLAGMATDICVLFTANDAYMRDYRLVVPADCSASQSVDEHRHAIEQMRQALKADVRPSTELDPAALLRDADPSSARPESGPPTARAPRAPRSRRTRSRGTSRRAGGARRAAPRSTPS